MTIPKPVDITCRHQAAWAYLTVPFKRGHTQKVQHKVLGGDWEDSSQQLSDWLVPMSGGGKPQATQWRARYMRHTELGEWATGRVWMPDGFEQDGGEVTLPKPEGFTASGIGGSAVRTVWAKPAVDPDSYLFAWRREGQKHWTTRVINRGEVEIIGARRGYTVRDLARYTPYEISVRAVIGGHESEPALLSVLTTGRTDDKFGPADPADATVDAVNATSATISWDQDDPRAVQHWQIGGAGLESASPTEQEHRFVGLTPGKTYTAQVVARGHDQSYCDGYAEVGFTTTGSEPPDQRRPKWIADSGSTPTALAVEWERRGDETQWAVRLDGNPFEYVPGDDTPEFSWPGLEPGSKHSVEVRCQVDGSWLPRDTARKEWFTLPDTDPTPRPDPPTGLHFHCIADITAKAEWDQNGDVDAWEVWVGDDRAQGAISTVTPLVNLRNLDPDTTYTVHVVAQVGHPGEPGFRESEPASGTFTTLETVLPPDENPHPIPGDLPEPRNLMVRAVSDTELDATWTELRPDVGSDSQFYVVTVDGVQWERVNTTTARFTDLAAGRHVVDVYGVVDNQLTGIARKATTLKTAQEVSA